MQGRLAKRKDYKAVADDAMALEYGNGSLGVFVVVVLDKVMVGHALLLGDVDSRLDDIAETGRVWIAGLERLGHHAGR